MSLFNINKDFGWQASREFSDILSKIRDSNNLGFISYIRYYPDKVVPLFNDPLCVNHCLSFSSYVPPGWLLSEGKHLWTEYLPHDLLMSLKNNFQYNHGLVLINNHSQFKEQLTITLNPTENDYLQHYYNNTKLHREIMQNILTQGDTLIQEAMKHAIYYDEHHLAEQEKFINNKISPSQKAYKPRVIRTDIGYCSLSKKELICFINILKMKSNKETANEMNISLKTVEYHITKLHKKTWYIKTL